MQLTHAIHAVYLRCVVKAQQVHERNRKFIALHVLHYLYNRQITNIDIKVS